MQRTARVLRSKVNTPLPHFACLSTGFCTQYGSRQLATLDAPLEQVAQSWRGIKRFYDHVGIQGIQQDGNITQNESDAQAWQVVVQGRALKTNGLNELLLPTKSLAFAIAAEFAAQRESVIPATTPLYNMVCNAVDQFERDDLATIAAAEVAQAAVDRGLLETSNNQEESIQGGTLENPNGMNEDSNRPEIRYGMRQLGAASGAFGSSSVALPVGLAELNRREELTQSRDVLGTGETIRLRELLKDYLETDSVCYRIPLDGNDPDEALLRRRQDKYYEPLQRWFESTFAVKLGTAEGLADVHHPTEAYEVVEDIVDAAHPYLRAALGTVIGSVHSTLIALALVFRHITPEQALAASRVEEEYQIEINGFVEDGHDTSRIQSRVKLAAASSLLWMAPHAQPSFIHAAMQDKSTSETSMTDEMALQELELRLQRVRARREIDRTILLIERAEKARARANMIEDEALVGLEGRKRDLAMLHQQLERLQKNINNVADNAGMRSLPSSNEQQ